jgi:membrane peptidoglycan carboxypeptidase
VAGNAWQARRQPSPLTGSGIRIGVFLGVLAVASLLFALALLPSIGVAGRAVQRFNDEFVSIGTEAEFAYPRFPVRSTVYAADGSVLATLFGDENRKIVRIGQINDVTRKAVLAIEDTKFYEHPGVDVMGIFRAVLANLKAGEIAQGASTITQQLARNAFPSVGTERTLARKLQELKVAKRLEEEYSKDEILELYLNRVYFGRGVYGIGTAAEYYFSKRAEDLTLPEAATLAGLIAAPEKWSPATDMEAAVGRRNQVLLRMSRLGWVSEPEAEQAMALPIELRLKPPSQPRAPFFVRYLTNRILDDPRFGSTREARKQTLFQGGLKIYTTVDPRLQRAGAKAVHKQLPDPKDPESAIATVDARTGAIRALVSSVSFQKSQVNLATGEGGTGRQSGSAFKPFTLVAAFEQGIPQMKVYNGASGQTVDCGPGNAPYTVNNADGTGSYMNLWSATESSVNAVFVQLSVDAGLENVVEAAHRMGIESPLQPFCSLTLGTNEVTPLEMASAFSTLANEGKHCQPFAITRVEDRNGNVIFRQKHGPCTQVVDKKIAALVVNMLERVVTSGTGTRANLGSRPVFGKTGSTNELNDAWFTGCTRQLCSATWVGHKNALIPMYNVHEFDRVYGGTIPALIWYDFMVEATRGMRLMDFPTAPAPEAAAVPNVLGKTQQEAEEILAEANFTPIVRVVPSLVPAGQVSAQSPAAGASVTAGSAVFIHISNGAVPTFAVPNVTGLTEAKARAKLTAKGFGVVVQYWQTGDPAQSGIVASQTPGAGSPAAAGTQVLLGVWWFGEPPPGAPPPVAPPTAPSPQPGAGMVPPPSPAT